MTEEVLSTRVYNIIKERIKLLEYYPGSAFTKEKELSASLDISRTPIREAIQRLTQEKWLVHGCDNHLYVRALVERDVYEVMEIRSIISYCAVEAIMRRDLFRHTAGVLDNVLNDMKRAESACDFTNAENKFHNLLLQNMNNKHMLNFWANIHDEVFRMSFFVLRDKKSWPGVIAEHELLVNEFWNKDVCKIREAIRSHLLSSYRSITEAIGGSSAGPIDEELFFPY